MTFYPTLHTIDAHFKRWGHMMQPVHGIYVALLSGDSFLGHDQKWSDTSWLHHPQVSLCSLFDFILFAAGWGKSFRGWSFCSFQEIHYISLGKWTIIDCIRKNNAMTQKRLEMLVNTCDQLICVYVDLQWIKYVMWFVLLVWWHGVLYRRMIYFLEF